MTWLRFRAGFGNASSAKAPLPRLHQRAYAEKQRELQSADDAARQRFAEMLRVTGKETAAEKEQRRLAREGRLRG
jgi:hypothetical protein